MVKVFRVMKRKNGLTREQFLQHWKEIHGPLQVSKDVPGLRRYIQDYPVAVTGPDFDTDIDGIAELWFDDIESAQAFYRWLRSSDEAKDVREDLKLFVSTEEGFRFLVEEHVFKDKSDFTEEDARTFYDTMCKKLKAESPDREPPPYSAMRPQIFLRMEEDLRNRLKGEFVSQLWQESTIVYE